MFDGRNVGGTDFLLNDMVDPKTGQRTDMIGKDASVIVDTAEFKPPVDVSAPLKWLFCEAQKEWS